MEGDNGMRVLDPGHSYELEQLDTGKLLQLLHFVKREGEKYPGNVGSHGGVTTQEVLRVLINRTRYVNNQIYFIENEWVIDNLQWSLYYLENRAAAASGFEMKGFDVGKIETYPTCSTCGHIWCNGERHGRSVTQG